MKDSLQFGIRVRDPFWGDPPEMVSHGIARGYAHPEQRAVAMTVLTKHRVTLQRLTDQAFPCGWDERDSRGV